MYEDITLNVKDYNIIGSARSKRFFSERNNLFIRENHKILKHKTFWLSKSPDKVGSQLGIHYIQEYVQQL